MIFILCSIQQTSKNNQPFMLTSTQEDNKFWNKKQASDFMITAPKSLQAYFGKTQSKLHIGHLSMNKQFTGLSLQDSLENILSKKLRGVKLCPDSQSILQKQISFTLKKSTTKLTLTLEQLLTHFLTYKNEKFQKCILSSKLSTNLIKPFMKIYWFLSNEQLVIEKKSDLQKELHSVFQKMEKIQRNIYQNQVGDDQCSVHEKDLENKNVRVVEEVGKVLGVLEKVGEEKEQEDQARSKVATTYHYLKSLKSLNPGTLKQLNTNRNLVTEKIMQTKKAITKTAKKIKFKNIHTTNNEDTDLSEDEAEDLCYELGLLISDTDRILKPIEDDNKIND